MGILSKVSVQIQKKHKIDKKAYLKKVTVTDLKNLSRALVEADATAGSPACSTCCCCCAAAVEPAQL